MTELARLELTERNGVMVAAIVGEIDLSNSAQLEHGVLAGVGSAVAVVLDLTGVTFVDSAGVRLLDHLTAAFAPPRALLVAGAGRRVRFTLRLCGFPLDLMCADVESAVAELGPRDG